MTRNLLFALAGLLLSACMQTAGEGRQAEALSSESAMREPSPAHFIKLTKTACFGTCPAFDLTLYGDGRVLFHGSRYTKQTGQQITQFSTGRFMEALAALDMRGFRDLDARYDRETCKIWATDHPTVIIEIRAPGVTKSVTWYRGCRGVDDRAKLERIVDELDRILSVDRFTGTEAERERLFSRRDN